MAGLTIVLIFFSCFAFLKKFTATIFVSSFLSKAITEPFSGRADDVQSGELLMRSDDSINAAILLSTDVKIDIEKQQSAFS